MARERRPATIQLDRVKCRVIRGPREGRWYWQAVVYENAGQRTVWTGWATRADAVQELSALIASGGTTPKAQVTGRLNTVRELVSAWWALGVEPRSDIGRYTKRNYRLAARHWVTTCGDVRVDHVGVETMTAHRDLRLRKGAATSTVKRELVAMLTCWAWARDRGHVPDRRLAMVALEDVPVRDRHTPSEMDVRRVLAVLDATPRRHSRGLVTWPWMAVHLLAATGARIGEIAGLRWADVDLVQGLLLIRGKRSRRNRSGVREVPVERALVTLLQAWRGRQAVEACLDPSRVLGVASRTVEVSLSGNYLKLACEQAGVRSFTPHGLRRYAEDRLANSGVDIAEYAAILGHSPAVALAHYRRATTDSMRRAVEGASMALAGSPRVLPFPSAP